MAHDQRWYAPAGTAVPTVYVTAADSAGLYLDNDAPNKGAGTSF